MNARCLMVLGTTSGAGKSWLTTALCRYYARQGLKVAPFKAQNMSNNARVVPGPAGGYGEIGSAQYLQALAARARPEVRMNPVLLKPEADTRSQVVVLGQVEPELAALPWRERGPRLWPLVAAALDSLRADHDLVVIEGAGSPAEINLMDSDIVNLRVARHADARCLLVTDIDRGGAFAHLYGTWALLPAADRARLAGFVLNRFRGDAALLAPGPGMLCERTGVPTLATLPMWWEHGLPEEDGIAAARPQAANAMFHEDADTPAHAPGRALTHGATGSGARTVSSAATVAIIAGPHISNHDEFQPLCNVPGLRLVWARTPADCASADLIILPGSKQTAADLAWLRGRGLDATIARHADRGGLVLGVCGGLQMLGEALIDLHAIDGNGPGLGLLPLVTAFEPVKTVRPAHARFDAVQGPWSALSGLACSGYEIHHGQTAQHQGLAAQGNLAREVVPGLAWQNAAGNVLGLYVHGLFEDPAILHAVFGARARDLDTVFDGLADFIAAHFAPGALDALISI